MFQNSQASCIVRQHNQALFSAGVANHALFHITIHHCHFCLLQIVQLGGHDKTWPHEARLFPV